MRDCPRILFETRVKKETPTYAARRKGSQRLRCSTGHAGTALKSVKDDVLEATRDYFFAFWALTFAHLAFMAAEILALAAALILPFLHRAAVPGREAPPPERRFSSFCKRSICSRIATARLSCLTDSAAQKLFSVTIQ